jgi:cephalosporin-C deacetylase
MPSIDMPVDQLLGYKPQLTTPPDLNEFWSQTLAELRSDPLEPQIEPIDFSPSSQAAFFLVRYQGFGGAMISGYLARPKESREKIPCILHFHGYSGSKPFLLDLCRFTNMGWAVLSIDIRGQNGESSSTSHGDGGAVAGWLTIGIDSPQNYYYRGVYADCVRAFDLASSLSFVDETRIAATGGSQGGALTIATAALEPRISAYAPDIAFLCHFRRAVEIAPDNPYQEIETYLRKRPDKEEQVFRTLSYFDCMNLAPWLQAPGFWCVGGNDSTCPPSTTMAAYNHAGGEKKLKFYRYNYHETPEQHILAKMRWLAERLA